MAVVAIAFIAAVIDTDSGNPAGDSLRPGRRELVGAGRTDRPARPATTSVTRTNRAAAVSRTAGQLDLFWVGTNHHIHQVGDPAILVHPLANLCTISRSPDRIDVLVTGLQPGTVG